MRESTDPGDRRVPAGRPDAVIFDMDGVLVFSEEAWFAVYNETLVHFGHAAISRQAFDAIYGNGTEADRAMYMPERSVAEIDAAYDRFFRRHLGAIRVNEEAPAALAALRGRGVKTGLATNTNGPLAARILLHADLRPLLDAVASADEAGAGKPDPAVLRLASRRLGVPLARSVFVGDSRYDAEAARRAPVPFVGFRRDGDGRVDRLSALPGLLG